MCTSDARPGQPGAPQKILATPVAERWHWVVIEHLGPQASACQPLYGLPCRVLSVWSSRTDSTILFHLVMRTSSNLWNNAVAIASIYTQWPAGYADDVGAFVAPSGGVVFDKAASDILLWCASSVLNIVLISVSPEKAVTTMDTSKDRQIWWTETCLLLNSRIILKKPKILFHYNYFIQQNNMNNMHKTTIWSNL